MVADLVSFKVDQILARDFDTRMTVRKYFAPSLCEKDLTW